LRLHFSGTLLGSARRTGLLPVCGRNLYNCLCSLFFCSLLYPLHIDSELTQTLNYFRLWTWEQLSRTFQKKFPKTQFNPPFLWFFSPLNIPCLQIVLDLLFVIIAPIGFWLFLCYTVGNNLMLKPPVDHGVPHIHVNQLDMNAHAFFPIVIIFSV